MKLYLRNDEGVAMKFVGIRRVENAGQILKWKYIKSKLEFAELFKVKLIEQGRIKI